MKFRPEERRNPFENPVVAFCAHAAAQVGMALAIYWSLMVRSWVPVAFAFVVFAGVEGLWLYYRLPR